ncbi:YybH family protein [Pseudarthrobacter sp. J1738]|uniref:YybH family protein n=1 Tax=unclassified Pseudarthrobacter TaxID=2647000 RepID=UPI003D2C6942
MNVTEQDVIAAAENLIGAFGAGNAERYFACFALDATFVFYTEPQRIASRDDYQQLWQKWIESGWQVLGCVSSNSRIHLAGDAGIFVHDVQTTIEVNGVREVLQERETIVFARNEHGELLAVHEHLSPAPHEDQNVPVFPLAEVRP